MSNDPSGIYHSGSTTSKAMPVSALQSLARDSQDYHTPMTLSKSNSPPATAPILAGGSSSHSSNKANNNNALRSCEMGGESGSGGSPSPPAVGSEPAVDEEPLARTRGPRSPSSSDASSTSPSPSPAPMGREVEKPQPSLLSPMMLSSTSSSTSFSPSLTAPVKTTTASSSSDASASAASTSSSATAVNAPGIKSASSSSSASPSLSSASPSADATVDESGMHAASSHRVAYTDPAAIVLPPPNNSNATSDSASSSQGGSKSSSTSPCMAGGNFSSFGNVSMVSPSSPSISPTNASFNPRRSLNAAFTISPRTESDVEASEEYNSDAPSVCLELDRRTPPVKQYCNLGSLEERRAFVTTGCVAAAKAMSTTRIIDHLLPALLTAFEADDYGESFDDCAPSIARALPQVIACMERKTTANLLYFMGLIMELCCSAEETVVAEITKALQAIIGMVADDVVLDLFLPFVLTMRVSFWSAPRMVSASLLGCIAVRPAVLQASGLSVTDMFNYYAECSTDASAMVRSAVVTSLHEWVRVAAVHHLTLAEMPLPLLKSLATDDLSDTVRYLLIEEIAKLSRLIGRKSTSKYLLSTFVSAYVDPSWRVRFTTANHLGTMAGLVLNADDLEVVLDTLAADEEPETRAAVARQLDNVVQHCSSDMVQHCCLPIALTLSQDPNPVVRRSAARHYHCLVFGSDEVVRAMCKSLRSLMEDAAFVVQESAIQSLGDLVTGLHNSVRAAEQHAVLSSSLRSTNSNGSNSNNGSGTAAATATGANTGTGLSSSASSCSPASRRQHHPNQPSSHSTQSRSARHQSTSSPQTTRLLTPGSNSGANTPLAVGGGSGSGAGRPAEANAAFMKKRTESIARAFVPELQTLSESRNWRIREAVVNVSQYFAQALPSDQFLPLTNMLYIALHDPVSIVRSQTIQTLKEVAVAYGGDWAAQTATELLHSSTLSPAHAVSYMWRVVLIQCLEVLLPVISELSAQDPRRRQLLALTVALLQQYAADRVPNVRIATALALPKWFTWFDVSEVERAAYNGAIGTLQKDTDVDVLNASQHIPYNTNGSSADASAAVAAKP